MAICVSNFYLIITLLEDFYFARRACSDSDLVFPRCAPTSQANISTTHLGTSETLDLGLASGESSSENQSPSSRLSPTTLRAKSWRWLPHPPIPCLTVAESRTRLPAVSIFGLSHRAYDSGFAPHCTPKRPQGTQPVEIDSGTRRSRLVSDESYQPVSEALV